jgi:NADPH2:quinone reductase
MRKVEAAALASLEGYRLVEVDAPRAGAGEVLVQVAACGLGYVDALVALGRYQVKPPLPHTPGQEVSGRVAEVGAGVEGLRPGDRVLATSAAASPVLAARRRRAEAS